MNSLQALLIFTAAVNLLLPSLLLAGLSDQIMQCATLKQDSKRLQCYDNFSLHSELLQNKNVLKPPKEFLISELRAVRHESDYTLSVADFIELIRRAKLENGNPIVIMGWNIQQHSFSLDIDMQKKVTISFTHFKTKQENISLLLPVIIDGSSIDPSVFITTIASMTPD